MKYKPSVSTIQAFWPKPSAMAAAILLLTAPAFRGFSSGVPLLQITENSSTTLTVTWGGTTWTVADTTPDHWTITMPVPSTGTFGTDLVAALSGNPRAAFEYFPGLSKDGFHGKVTGS